MATAEQQEIARDSQASPAAVGATAEAAAKALTLYVILSSTDGGKTLKHLGAENGASRANAITRFFDGKEDKAVADASYYAVPVTSMQPMKARRRPGVSVSEA